jgi:general secretion pathway protein H
MQILAVGSKPLQLLARLRLRLGSHQRGFTLLELLVVVAIIAMGTGGVMLALQDGQATRTEREGQRLAALLESARAQSRTLGTPVRWRAQGRGFVFDGLSAKAALPTAWLNPDTALVEPVTLELGPDPILTRQSVVLTSSTQPTVRVRVGTDGLHPFQIESP